MKETIILKTKPISINKCNRSIYYPKHGGKSFSSTIKSKEYRDFEKKVSVLLSKDNDKLRAIANAYVNGKNFFVLSYVFKFPREKYFTKKGTISKRCADLDNLLKPLNDQIFKHLSRYNSDIDDSSVVGIKAMKIPVDSDYHEIVVEMELHESLNGITIY